MDKGKHFVLVHGGFHGAWCWYKIVSLLKSGGYQVTALDLGACGINPMQLQEVASMEEYMEPLMKFLASLPEEERVILVGHSFGGVSISLAMERFPNKVLVGVYVTAMVPNLSSTPASVLLELFKSEPLQAIPDYQFSFGDGPENPPTSALVGPKYMETNLYQNCPPEDLELARMLVRPNGLFLKDLSKETLLTEDNFGSIKRVFVKCEEDKSIKNEYQESMIENSQTKDVRLLAGADHMAMLSKPKELFLCLKQIAEEYN